MDLSAVARHLAAASAELSAANARPLRTAPRLEPQPHIRALIFQLHPLVADDIGPSDVLVALSYLCLSRRDACESDGYLEAARRWQDAAEIIDVISCDVRADYIGERIDADLPTPLGTVIARGFR